jgi:hypothetical protein
VLLSKSSSGLTVGQELRLECERKKMFALLLCMSRSGFALIEELRFVWEGRGNADGAAQHVCILARSERYIEA